MCKFFDFLAKIFRWALPTVGALALVALISEPTYASLASSVLGGSDWSAITGPIATIISGIIIVIVLISLIFSLLLGDLMDSTHILDSGMGDTLHLVWEVMRNFVNVGFILILLIIAVMVIFGGGGERGLGMLKKVLPKFVLALVLVNFTFFMARFVLTANDVLATAIFSLPRVVSAEKQIRMPCDPNKIDATTKKPITCLDQFGEILTKVKKEENGMKDYTKILEEITSVKDENGKDRWFPQTVKGLSLGRKNISLVLLTSMIDLEHIVNTKGIIGNGSDMIIAALGSLIVAGAVGIVFFMLFLAFVVRMVVLWIAIAVSPLAALGMVMKEVIPGADMSGDLDPVKIFISHAFMPTLVAIPLSIGMIMIFANNAIGIGTSGIIQTFSSRAGDIHAILWWVASIIVIWFGTNKMISKASPDFAQKLTEGVHSGVNKFVGAAAGTLKYAPIVPAWGAPMAALNRMKTTGQNRQVSAGDSMLKNSGINRSWYDAPTTRAQVREKTNSLANAKDLSALTNSIHSLETHLQESSNGLAAMDEGKLSSATLAKTTALTGIKFASNVSLHDYLNQVANDEHSGVLATDKIKMRGKLGAISSGVESPVESDISYFNDGATNTPTVSVKGGLLAENKTDKKMYLVSASPDGKLMQIGTETKEKLERDMKDQVASIPKLTSDSGISDDVLEEFKEAAKSIDSALQFHTKESGKKLYQDVVAKLDNETRKHFVEHLKSHNDQLSKDLGL